MGSAARSIPVALSPKVSSTPISAVVGPAARISAPIAPSPLVVNWPTLSEFSQAPAPRMAQAVGSLARSMPNASSPSVDNTPTLPSTSPTARITAPGERAPVVVRLLTVKAWSHDPTPSATHAVGSARRSIPAASMPLVWMTSAESVVAPAAVTSAPIEPKPSVVIVPTTASISQEPAPSVAQTAGSDWRLRPSAWSPPVRSTPTSTPMPPAAVRKAAVEPVPRASIRLASSVAGPETVTISTPCALTPAVCTSSSVTLAFPAWIFTPSLLSPSVDTRSSTVSTTPSTACSNAPVLLSPIVVRRRTCALMSAPDVRSSAGSLSSTVSITASPVMVMGPVVSISAVTVDSKFGGRATTTGWTSALRLIVPDGGVGGAGVGASQFSTPAKSVAQTTCAAAGAEVIARIEVQPTAASLTALMPVRALIGSLALSCPPVGDVMHEAIEKVP